MTYADFLMPQRPDRQLRSMLVAIVLAAATICAGRAVAAEPSSAASSDKPAAHKKRTVLKFGEDGIHGDLTRPDGELVQAPRKPSQPSLLRVRRNFLDRALSGAQRGQ